MKSINAAVASLVALAAVPAFANPLDLSSSVSSIQCEGIRSDVSMNYDGDTKVVTLVVDGAQSEMSLESLKKGVAGSATLLARTSDGSHLLATILPNNGQSLIQVAGTSFYVRCEVR